MGGSAMGYEYEAVNGCVRIMRCTQRRQDLIVPEHLNGMAVTAIAPYAFEGNTDVRSITCPPQVTEIGSRAFANCPTLESIRFPTALARYDNSWVAGCTRLREIQLPGSIQDLNLPSPAPLGVKRILIGQNTNTVHLSRTWKTRLEQVDVHPANRWLSSDGNCIYNADGTVLITHATRSSAVRIAEGCLRVAPLAFEHEQNLQRVMLPEGVLEVGERAFAESALLAFTAPQSLQRILPEAFASCKLLSQVSLGEGMREIGERAFEDCTACQGVRIPAGVTHVGRKAFEGSGLMACGEQPTLTVSDQNPTLFIDESGVLCERKAEGVVVREALDMQVTRYHTPGGTVRIAEKAFFAHPNLEQLEIREGVTCVGEEAFMRCERLRNVTLPQSLQRLEARAFATTALVSCLVPAGVEHLGECALAFNFKNWHPTTNPPEARAHVMLQPGNVRYYVDGGLLYERCAHGGARVILYVGPEIDITVPDGTHDIAPYAFFGVQGIRELHLPAYIPIGEATFAMRKPPERVVLTGEGGITLQTMHDWRGVCALQRSFAGDGTTNARLLCTTFDEEALGATPDHEVFRYMVSRICQPEHLPPTTRDAFRETLRMRLSQACIAFAQHGSRSDIDRMADAGIINRDSIDEAIQAASTANNAAVMARLHELKRTRFPAHKRDYDL